MKEGFKKGDQIIWDSHFGYEIGIFRGEGVSYYTYEVDICSGKYPGILSPSQNEIHPYSNSLLVEMKRKYGYEKQFSTTF